MKVRIPFSPRIYDSFFNFLVSEWDYSVEDALFIADFISSHPGFVVYKTNPRRKNLNKFNAWFVLYKPASISFPDSIRINHLLEFIKNDCLPF